MSTHQHETAPSHAEPKQTIRRALLVAEYGETEAEWREMHSVERIADALATLLTAPAPTSPREAHHG